MKNYAWAIGKTIATAAAIGCLGLSSQADDNSVLAGAVSITINNNTEHQIMAGFGATHLSLVYEVDGQMVDFLGPALRAQAIDAIYNQVHLNTGNLAGSGGLESPADFSQRRNDNPDPFNTNWDGFNFNNAGALKQAVVDLAGPAFADFYIDPKINVRWASPWLADIRSTDYQTYLDECAEQTLTGQIYWRDTYGIVPQYSMLFNEPRSGNRELWPGTNPEVVDIVKRAGDRLRSAGFEDILFVVPGDETEQSSLNIATAIMNDPLARQYVGAIAFHPYPFGSVYSDIGRILATSGTGNPDPEKVAIRNQLRDLGAKNGIPVWMTEVSNGGVDPRSFDDLRGRAIHIHDELIYADAAAYFGMNNMWDRRSQLAHFGNNNLYGSSSEGTIVLIDQDHQKVTITGMGYAIGHYARWFDPGAIRIDAESSDPLVQVTAFRDDAQGRVVLVVINNATVAKSLEVNINAIRLVGKIIGEQSTSAAPWREIDPINLTKNARFTTTLPAESVTTFSGSFRKKIDNSNKNSTIIPRRTIKHPSK